MIPRRQFDIEICSHVWAVNLPVYRTHLKFQLASLVHFADSMIDVCYTVYVSGDDHETIDYLDRAKMWLSENVEVNVQILENGSLFRRAVGRNKSALAAKARVYWFTDVDYMFGRDCLLSLMDKVDETTCLVYPKYVKINPDHATGDKMCDTSDQELLPSFDDRLFIAREQKVAIGGVHIIGVDHLEAINPKTGKAFGYINGHRKCQPVDEAGGFRSCRCDLSFRREHQPAKQILVQNVFRIRHTSAGRAFDLAGNREPMKGDHD